MSIMEIRKGGISLYKNEYSSVEDLKTRLLQEFDFKKAIHAYRKELRNGKTSGQQSSIGMAGKTWDDGEAKDLHGSQSASNDNREDGEGRVRPQDQGNDQRADLQSDQDKPRPAFPGNVRAGEIFEAFRKLHEDLKKVTEGLK